jgi:outer membrane cobalamin receptor
VRGRWILGLAALCLATEAWADPKDDARRHFGAGLKAAQEGDYEIALQRFLAAQEAWPHPATLYNIAKAYTDLEDLPNAITYYRLYREAVPERAPDVDPVLSVLEARLGQQGASPQAAPSGPAGSASGPTNEELARLDAIARELAALTEALQDRTVAPPSVGTDEEPPDGVAAGPSSEELARTEFLEDAYERVVVSASRVGQDPLDSPSTVTVLTADDIRLSGVIDLLDLLRRVAGVEVMAQATGHSDIAIRGFQRKMNNKVLILVDGRSTEVDFIGVTFANSIPIQLEEIERIEVIRGPGSAVYGANAVTGVINIITRTPGEGDQVVTASSGTPGIGRAAAVATGRAGATTYRLSAGIQQHGRWAKEVDLDRRPDASVTPFLANDDLGSDALRLNARVDRTLGDWGAVSLTGGVSRNQSEFYSFGALTNFGLELDHYYARADLFVNDVHLRAYYNGNRGRTGPWLQYPGERDLTGEIDNDVVDVEAELPLEFGTGAIAHRLLIGGGWRYKGMKFEYLKGGFDTTYVENHFKGFANEQATLGRVSAVASLRIDAHPLIALSQTISPRGALLLRVLEKTTVRATAGSAFRAPTGIESYMEFDLPSPVDGVFITDYGNRQLSPERITTLELGVHDASTFFHQADLVVYYNRVTDLVGLRDVTPTIAPFDPDNVGIEAGDTGWVNLDPAYTGLGVEADLELYPIDGVDLFANASLSQVTERAPGAAPIRDASSSAVKLNVGGSYRTPYRVDLSAWVNWLSPQRWGLRTFDPDTLAIVAVPEALDARLLASARVAARPLPDQDLEVAFVAWNFTELIGERYREHPEGQPVQSRLYGTVTWRF